MAIEYDGFSVSPRLYRNADDAKACRRLRMTETERAQWNEARIVIPANGWRTLADAEAFHASLPPELRAITAAFPFLKL